MFHNTPPPPAPPVYIVSELNSFLIKFGHFSSQALEQKQIIFLIIIFYKWRNKVHIFKKNKFRLQNEDGKKNVKEWRLNDQLVQAPKLSPTSAAKLLMMAVMWMSFGTNHLLKHSWGTGIPMTTHVTSKGEQCVLPYKNCSVQQKAIPYSIPRCCCCCLEFFKGCLATPTTARQGPHRFWNENRGIWKLNQTVFFFPPSESSSTWWR